MQKNHAPFIYADTFYDIAQLRPGALHSAEQQQRCVALHAIIGRPEGLKVYFYQAANGALHAAAMDACELQQDASAPTQHVAMRRALLAAISKGRGRYASAAHKPSFADRLHLMDAMRQAVTLEYLQQAHAPEEAMQGGTRLCRNSHGAIGLVESASFSYLTPRPENVDLLARFYANVLLAGEQVPEEILLLSQDNGPRQQQLLADLAHLRQRILLYLQQAGACRA